VEDIDSDEDPNQFQAQLMNNQKPLGGNVPALQLGVMKQPPTETKPVIPSLGLN